MDYEIITRSAKSSSTLCAAFCLSIAACVTLCNCAYPGPQLHQEDSNLPLVVPADRRPVAFYVPDEKTAIRIAEAVWIPIYGERRASARKDLFARHYEEEGGGWREDNTNSRIARVGAWWADSSKLQSIGAQAKSCT
jgi:hypothetical protein